VTTWPSQVTSMVVRPCDGAATAAEPPPTTSAAAVQTAANDLVLDMLMLLISW
jgi:hypothetical protein